MDQFSSWNLKQLDFSHGRIINFQYSQENKLIEIVFDNTLLKMYKEERGLKNLTLLISHWSEVEIKDFEDQSQVGIEMSAAILTELKQISEFTYDWDLFFKGICQKEGKWLECTFRSPEISLYYDQTQVKELFEAVQKSNFLAIRQLIQEGIDPNQPLICETSNYFYTDYILIQAAKAGNFDMVRFLIEQGANVNVQSNSDGETPLICSFFSVHKDPEKSIQIIKYLVKAGADVNAKGGFCLTPLLQAIYAENKEIVLFLISHGADVNSFLENVDGNESRSIPIHAAIQSNNADLTESLISHGARLDLEDFDNLPLHEAVEQNNQKIVLLVLNHGADINQMNSIEETAFHEAIRKGNLAMVDFLLKQGANINACGNKYKKTPLHLAAQFSSKIHIAEYLLENGADKGAKNYNGETPLDLALRWNYNESNRSMIDLLSL